MTIEGPPNLVPQKKYCDITGFEVNNYFKKKKNYFSTCFHFKAYNFYFLFF
jgi:hypothetical protein